MSELMVSRLPGGAISPEEITYLRLLNGLDQIRDAAIFSPSLEQKTRETIVQAADCVKRRIAPRSEASVSTVDRNADLLNRLSNQVVKEMTFPAGGLDEKTGEKILEILNNSPKDPSAE